MHFRTIESDQVQQTGSFDKDKKKKLGIFVPERQKDHLQINLNIASVGCLYPPILNPFLEVLRSNDQIELLEGLNFRNALIKDGKIYCGDVCLNELDRFFWYCETDRIPGSFDLEVLRTLARDVEVVPDPLQYELALDKYRAHLCLHDAGVNVPETILFDHRIPDRMASILEEWGAAILKPRRGGWGKGVTLIDSVERLRDIVGYVASIAERNPDHGFFLERYLDNDPERWASITMINGEVALAYRKVNAKFHDLGGGKFKVHDIDEVGGGVVKADIGPEHIWQAKLAYDALGLGLIGFDMIWTEDGPYIVDENTAPGNYIDLYAQDGIEPGLLFAEWALEGLERED